MLVLIRAIDEGQEFSGLNSVVNNNEAVCLCALFICEGELKFAQVSLDPVTAGRVVF
jgi:hypothetical protein